MIGCKGNCGLWGSCPSGKLQAPGKSQTPNSCLRPTTARQANPQKNHEQQTSNGVEGRGSKVEGRRTKLKNQIPNPKKTQATGRGRSQAKLFTDLFTTVAPFLCEIRVANTLAQRRFGLFTCP